jgi:carbon storage regulator CsrA
VLVLSRKESQAITITTPAGKLRLTVERLSGKQVKLGFDGPVEIQIMRDEIAPSQEGEPSCIAP